MNRTAGFRAVSAAVALALGMIGARAAFAQQTQTQEPINQRQNELHYLTDVQRQQDQIDPAQTAAYKKFSNASADEPDAKIKLGLEFQKKYPTSAFTEAVDAGLTNAYFIKHDWKNFYAFADKTLALNPDEVDVLTNLGWVIPHQYNPNDPKAPQQLTAAENDEKHALDLLSRMAKPKGLSDSQFAAVKAQKSGQAHSALGLVYFRRGDYADSVKEMQESTQGQGGIDPTDFYVMGLDFQNLNRQADAVRAFTRCGQIAGPLQAPCQKAATQGKN